jgi:hypothetical protein
LVERLQRFYEARGYYRSRVTYNLQVDKKHSLVTVQIQVKENRPVTVVGVKVEISNYTPDPADPPLLGVRRPHAPFIPRRLGRANMPCHGQ